MARRCCDSRRARGGGLGGLKAHMGASGGVLGKAATSGIAVASGGVAVIASGLAINFGVFIAVVAIVVGRLHFRNSCWKDKMVLRWVLLLFERRLAKLLTCLRS